MKTTGTLESRPQNGMANNVYVLDAELTIRGSLEGLGAQRRHLLRTLSRGQVLPRDLPQSGSLSSSLTLTDPENPEVLGKLKIPGYSDYLHPLRRNPRHRHR